MPARYAADNRSAAELVSQGYRVVSRNHRHVARIDRANWRKSVPRALKGASAEDQYRRCVSQDKLTIPAHVLAAIPSSSHSSTGFIPPPQ